MEQHLGAFNWSNPAGKESPALRTDSSALAVASGWCRRYEKAGRGGVGKRRQDSARASSLPARRHEGAARECAGVENEPADWEAGGRGGLAKRRKKACSPVPRTHGTHRRHLLPRVHSFGRNDDSLAPPLCALADAGWEWLSWRSTGDQSAAVPTREVWMDPARKALSAQRMLQSQQSLPPQHSFVGRSCGQIPASGAWAGTALGRTDREGALPSRPQAEASQPRQVPAPRGWAGRQVPRGPHL